MYPATESARSESGPFVTDDYFFLTVLIRRATVEDNTASECIRTVTETYGCKILQLYECERTCWDTMRTARTQAHAAQKAEVFLYQSKQYMF